jgi:hydrogenase maturation protein HypF
VIKKTDKGFKITVKGLVQGVGFRPFVYHLARSSGLKGEVCNTTEGVNIILLCDKPALTLFMEELQRQLPQAAQIKSLLFSEIPVSGYTDFRIVPSDGSSAGITEISPDIAVCERCISEMKSQTHRIDYPFINCTQCGPRFTIVKDLPYDREKTTMKEFSMCEKCFMEYHDVSDRRFHAQPVACNNCGPSYHFSSGNAEITIPDEILKTVGSLINQGKILAVKGLGGYHLLCDAFNDESVALLRLRKGRDQKPFAVMFRDLQAMKEFCHVGHAEEVLITSWRRPVVLLDQKKSLAYQVNCGLTTIGAMLPYMPFHYLIFKEIITPAVVFTSGNIADNPTITDDAEAKKLLGAVTSFFISYNREIYNRADDSVVRVVGENISLIRRSRGYVPAPVDLGCNVNGILALGAELKNTFCIGKGMQAILSQHIGDLKGSETFSFYRETIDRFSRLFRFTPELLACDLHPDYLSTRHAENISGVTGIPLFKVQHHHAHIASCMAENLLDEKVIGITLDGTGFGTDGNSWGGEFFITDRVDFQRVAHFEYIPMPGGDKVISEPWRMAFSYLVHYPETRAMIDNVPLFREIEMGKTGVLQEMLEKKINTPLTSGAGRLFDAVAALTGVCGIASFEAEAPMRMESLVIKGVNEHYPYIAGPIVSFAPMFVSILADMDKKVKIPVISTKFHNTLAAVIADLASGIKAAQGIDKVVLSGGVFQNRYLLGKSVSLLEALNFKVYSNHLVPANDGGIALGQLVVANKKRMLCV